MPIAYAPTSFQPQIQDIVRRQATGRPISKLQAANARRRLNTLLAEQALVEATGRSGVPLSRDFGGYRQRQANIQDLFNLRQLFGLK